jgi:hypothetical protein
MNLSATIRIATIAVAAALAAPAADAATAVREGGGAIRFFDDRGNDRGYAWCGNRGGRNFGSWADCNYFTYAQCMEAVSWPPPGGYCSPNPFASQLPPPRRR